MSAKPAIASSALALNINKIRLDNIREDNINNNSNIQENITAQNDSKNRLVPSNVSTKSSSTHLPKIEFDEYEGLINITPRDIESWGEAYPACEIKIELAKMATWLNANPKLRKKNYRRFINNWLSRAQDQGGTKGASHIPSRDSEGEQKAMNEIIRHRAERKKIREEE
jgi:hypothetical protein